MKGHLSVVAAATAIVAAVGITGAVAQTFEKYGSEAGWDILVREDMGPGCMMMRAAPDGAQVQMGIDESTPEIRGYMALYTKAGANVAAGEKLSVIFDVDGDKFSGEAKGQELDGYRGAFVWVNNPDFIYDLAKKKQLTISADGREPIIVSLAGTNAAFETLRACQAAR